MSLPNPEREMLLSAALDGELSNQEQAAFDHAFATDPAFAAEFQKLQALQQNLRSHLQGLRPASMPAGSVDKIVAAAFAQRSVQPVSTMTKDSDIRQGIWKWAVPIAFAASLLFMLSISRQPQTEVKPIALLSPGSNTTSIQDNAPEPAQVGGLETPMPSAPAIPETVPQTSLAQQTPEPPKVMGIKPSDAGTTSPVMSPSIPDVASVSPDSPPFEPLQVVLVLAVELTTEGRDQLALPDALRAHDIRLDSKSVVGDALVTHLQQANVIESGPADRAGKLYFIEASAKRIDRFMTHLMTHPEWFASVGLSLAKEPPLLTAVDQLREVDPTKVRQDGGAGFALDLVAADGRRISVAEDHPFMPLSRDLVEAGLLQPAAPAANSTTAGEDFPAQLLLLVK